MSSADIWQQILLTPDDKELKERYNLALRVEKNPRYQIETLAERMKQHVLTYPALYQEAREQYERLVTPWQNELQTQLEGTNAEVIFAEGWPCEVTVSARDFADHAAHIVDIVPVRHLNLTQVSEAPELFEVTQLEQIASIYAGEQAWSKTTLTALTTSPYLETLRWLNLMNCDLQDSAVETLAAALNLRQLEYLNVAGNPCRDPVDAAAGYGIDGYSGLIVHDSIWLPEFGRELEARYGEINWLHSLDHYLEQFPPRRYSF